MRHPRLTWFLSVVLPILGLAGIIASISILTRRVHVPMSDLQPLHNSPPPQAIPAPKGMTGWSVTLGRGQSPLATPAVMGDKVFVGAGFSSFELYAINARTGTTMWAVRVSDDGPTGAVADDQAVVFNTESCTAYSLDANTGTKLWSKWLGTPLLTQPAVANGRFFSAYPSGGGHTLTCRDLHTGHEYWQAKVSSEIISSPVCAGDSVYVSTLEGQVFRFSAQDGTKLWTSGARATSAPWVANGCVYLAMREVANPSSPQPTTYEGVGTLSTLTGARLQNSLWGLRRADYLLATFQANTAYGQETKNQPDPLGAGEKPKDMEDSASPTGQPAASTLGPNGYAANSIGLQNVRGVWEYQGSRAEVVGNVLYTTMGSVVRAMDATTGRPLWERALPGQAQRLGGHLATPPSIAGGKLYLGTATGDLLCLDAKTGKSLWTYPVGNAAIRSQPAVANGRIYVGTSDGKLVCLDTGDPSADGWLMWGGSAGHNGPLTTGRTQGPPHS